MLSADVKDAAQLPQTSKYVAARSRGSVVDIYCGVGGLTHGFYLEGFSIAAGIDVNESCRYAFERNNRAPFIRKDAFDLNPAEIDDLFYKNEPKILIGCAPCQPFSVYNQKNRDSKWQLVTRFAELIRIIRPDVISMENVPRLLNFQGGAVFKNFINNLNNVGYEISYKNVYMPDYGIPQRRTRLVLLASRHGRIELEAPSCPSHTYRTVWETIGSLPPIAAGETNDIDPLHTASRLSEKNLARISTSKPGGTWRDWPSDLVAACHKADTGRGYVSVYGRMQADEPAPTITTQFHGFGNGRFGHPTQNRGLSIREGALLQTFPPDYAFIAPGEAIHFSKLGEMIGNAVPVSFAKVIARTIKDHLTGYHP